MAWRSSPATVRNSPGFIVPCQAILTPRAPTGPDWLHEIKHDGYRIIARKGREGLHLWTRQGRDYTEKLAAIARAVQALPGEFVLDGEAVAFNESQYDFHALRSRAGLRSAVLIAFDLLEFKGRDLRLLPVEVRREQLAKLLGKTPPDGLLYSQEIEGEGPEVFAHACAFRLEGIVSKRRGSAYVSGPSYAWLKAKNRHFERP